jgi:hypothetical protein
VEERPLRSRLATNANRQLRVMLDKTLEQLSTAEFRLLFPVRVSCGSVKR